MGLDPGSSVTFSKARRRTFSSLDGAAASSMRRVAYMGPGRSRASTLTSTGSGDAELDVHPPSNRQRHSGDIGRFIGSQEERSPCHFVGLASVLIFHEPMNPKKVVVLLLAMVSVLLLWKDKQADEKKQITTTTR
jgi:hypothetical protein